LTLQPRDAASVAALESHPGGRSVYVLDLPYANLPQPRLVLDTPERVFQRRIRVAVERDPDRRHRDRWLEEIGAADWRHADRLSAAPALSIPLGRSDATTLLVVVEEGDNAALPLTQARLLLPTYRLRFYHPASGSVRLLYGRRDLAAPTYDLALLAPHVMGSVAAVATLAPESAEAALAARERQSVISPLTFWILLGGAVLVMVMLIVRLVRTST
jgi:hypothetical protein